MTLCQGERRIKKYRRKGDEKNTNREGRRNQLENRSHTQREKQKSNKVKESGEVGDLAIGVTPGRGFLSSILRSRSTKSEASIYTAL